MGCMSGAWVVVALVLLMITGPGSEPTPTTNPERIHQFCQTNPDLVYNSRLTNGKLVRVCQMVISNTRM